MQGRIAAMITCGFMSFLMIGAAGAAADTYFEASVETNGQEMACLEIHMEREDVADGLTGCSVHRVSPTYGRQIMAKHLSYSEWDDD